MVLDAVQARLADDPTAPPPDQLSFTVFSDPSREHSFLALFPPGTYIPILDYTVQEPSKANITPPLLSPNTTSSPTSQTGRRTS